MPGIDELMAARQAVNAAMVRIENRIGVSTNDEEIALLKSGYEKLVDLYREIILDAAAAQAKKVARAASKLQAVIASASTDPLEIYLRKLRGELKKFGANIPPEVANDTSSGGVPIEPGTTPDENGNEDGPIDSSGSWKRLVSLYKMDQRPSTELKVASLSQWIVESGRGTSSLSRDFKNFGGLKYRERMQGYATPVVYTGSDGEETEYCEFGSERSFIDGYWHFIRSGSYGNWEEYEGDAEGYIREIGPSYAADPAYIDKVISVFDEARQLLSTSTTLPEVSGDVDADADINNTKLAIVVGHNAISKGAYAKAPISASEFDFNNLVAEQMLGQAQHFNITAKVFNRVKHSSGYSKEIAACYEQVRKWGPDSILELHFNSASDPAATGTECLHAVNNPSAAILAKSVVDELYETLGLKLRHQNGVKAISSSQRGWRSVTAIQSVPTVLTEPFFGSNQRDRNRAAAAGHHQVALAYLRGVRDYHVE